MRGTILSMICAVVVISTIYALPFTSDTLLDPRTFNMCMNSPTRDEYPDAKYVVIFGEKTIVLQSDGGYTVEWRMVYKVLTFMGKKELSNLKYLYDTGYENIDIGRARSMTQTGDSVFTVVVSDSLQINDITPPGLSEAGIYANLQQRVVTVPGVVDSSLVDIGGRIETFEKPNKPFGGIEFLAQESPVWHYRLVIEVPEGDELIYESANGAPEPIIEDNRYVWTIQDYEGIVPEPGGPRGRDLLPCVFYTTTGSWNLTADYIQGRFAPKIMPTQDVTGKANEIVGEMTGLDAVDTLASWVARNIEKIDIDLGDAGYIPNDAATVLKNGYADTRDRCVLLSSLLKARGIESRIAVLPPRDVIIREDVPTLAQFNKMTAAVPDGEGGWIFLWAEDDFSSVRRQPWFDGETALLVTPGKGELVSLPRVDPIEQSMIQDYKLKLDPDGGIEGVIYASFGGDYGHSMRRVFRDSSPNRRKQRMEKIVSNIGNGELRGDDPFSLDGLDDNNIVPSLNVEFESGEFAFIQGEIMIFNFPDNPMDFVDFVVPTSLDERKEPLVLDTPFKVDYSFEVEIPAGYEVAWVSENLDKNNDTGELHVSSYLEDKTVQYKMSLVVNNTWISTDQYEYIKGLISQYISPRNRMILLEKTPEENEDE